LRVDTFFTLRNWPVRNSGDLHGKQSTSGEDQRVIYCGKKPYNIPYFEPSAGAAHVSSPTFCLVLLMPLTCLTCPSTAPAYPANCV
jgi:hypothetical protein